MTEDTTAAVATTYQSRMVAFKETWEKALPIVRDLLPAGVAAERIFSVAVTARQRNPTLLQCSDISVLRGIIVGAQLGLDISGVGGKAYLVPYKINGKWEAQFQIGYRGLMELVRRTGQIAAIYADVVYEHDDFVYENGLNPVLRHVRKMVGEPGEVVGAWAVAVWNNGFRQCEVMSRAELDRVRASSKARSDSSPWEKWFDQMSIKTVLKRVCKKLPDSVEMQTVTDIEDSAEAGVHSYIDTTVLPEPPEAIAPAPTKTEAVKEAIKATVAPPPVRRGPGRPPGAKNKPVALDSVIAESGELPEPGDEELPEAEVDDDYEP